MSVEANASLRKGYENPCFLTPARKQPPGYPRLAGLLPLFLGGPAQAATLKALDDSYGVPCGRPLQVEAFGVLGNDTIDSLPVGENGASAELVSDVGNGTLTCPSDASLALCPDGSFDYTPGPGFSGTDFFTYRTVFGADARTSATVTLTACTGGPDVFACWQESSYLAKLAELGYATFSEGFEGTAWDVARSPHTAPSVTSQGITWTSNHPATNDITTGGGAARAGQYGTYDPDHGFATGTPLQCDRSWSTCRAPTWRS